MTPVAYHYSSTKANWAWPGPSQSSVTQLRGGTALADARATDLCLDLFSSPTVRDLWAKRPLRSGPLGIWPLRILIYLKVRIDVPSQMSFQNTNVWEGLVMQRRVEWARLVLSLCYVILLIGSADASDHLFPDRPAAMRVFADLLKIPHTAPESSITVESTQEEEGVVVEDISWESLDKEHPQAFVLRPAKFKGPLPAIVCLHGSSGSRELLCTSRFGIGEWTRPGAKTAQTQLLGWARELSRSGYLTLALTQRGLDRRTPDTDDQAKDLLVRGRTLMGAIVYEIRQAVSYLRKRQDVDPARIGMTGISFGGITTFYTWLVDDRIAAAAPICGGVGSLDVFVQRGSRNYHGLYWWIPGMLTRGDQGDFAAAMAPRPLMLWAPLEDIGMPKEGVDRFLEVVIPAYARSAAPDALVVHRPPGGHTFSLEAFAAMKAFFDKYLKAQ